MTNGLWTHFMPLLTGTALMVCRPRFLNLKQLSFIVFRVGTVTSCLVLERLLKNWGSDTQENDIIHRREELRKPTSIKKNPE